MFVCITKTNLRLRQATNGRIANLKRRPYSVHLQHPIKQNGKFTIPEQCGGKLEWEIQTKQRVCINLLESSMILERLA